MKSIFGQHDLFSFFRKYCTQGLDWKFTREITERKEWRNSKQICFEEIIVQQLPDLKTGSFVLLFWLKLVILTKHDKFHSCDQLHDTPDMALPWSCHLIQTQDIMTPQTIQMHHIQHQRTKNGGIVIRSHHVQNKVPNQDRFLTLDEILNSCWADHLGFGLERRSHDYVLSYIGIELTKTCIFAFTIRLGSRESNQRNLGLHHYIVTVLHIIRIVLQ